MGVQHLPGRSAGLGSLQAGRLGGIIARMSTATKQARSKRGAAPAVAGGELVPAGEGQAAEGAGRGHHGKTWGVQRMELYKHSPKWQAAQARKAGLQQSADITPPPVTVLPMQPNCISNSGTDAILLHQGLSLQEIAVHALDAARYLGAVASGRKKGEQWRMRAAEQCLDRIGVTGDTVARAQIAAQAAASASADLGSLLERLVQARQLAARKAEAVDLETGQTSGKPEGA